MVAICKAALRKGNAISATFCKLCCQNVSPLQTCQVHLTNVRSLMNSSGQGGRSSVESAVEEKSALKPLKETALELAFPHKGALRTSEGEPFSKLY